MMTLQRQISGDEIKFTRNVAEIADEPFVAKRSRQDFRFSWLIVERSLPVQDIAGGRPAPPLRFSALRTMHLPGPSPNLTGCGKMSFAVMPDSTFAIAAKVKTSIH